MKLEFAFPPRFPSRRSTTMAIDGMVAASQPLAVQAGCSTLSNGGNAVDAAVVAALVLTVVEPRSTHLGGDALAIVSPRSDEIHGLNASGPAPSKLDPDVVTAAGHEQMPSDGPLTITVPGQLDGLSRLLQRFGTIGLDTALKPALNYAENGYPVTEEISARWKSQVPLLKKYSHGSCPYLPHGRAPQAGELFTNPDYSTTLRAVADEGPTVLYGGRLGGRIAAGVQAAGGLLTLEDLASYRSEWTDPISVSYGSAHIYELPPNSQGIVASLAFALLDGIHLNEWGTAQTLHHQIEATKLAFAEAVPHIADPRYHQPPAGLLGQGSIARLRMQIDPQRASTRESLLAPGSDTVYIAAGDGSGNLVSLITSCFAGFGSGIIPEGTAVITQNRASGFSMDPHHPNVLAPGKRPYHTIIPSLLRRHDGLRAAFGVMGGFMQPQGHVQLACNLLDFGMSPQQALDAPRYRVGNEGEVHLERGFSEIAKSKLEARGHRLEPETPLGFYGGGQVVVASNGVLLGGSDPRKDGLAIGI